MVSVIEFFDAVALPSINPSETTSIRVLNCFDESASEGKSGFTITYDSSVGSNPI